MKPLRFASVCLLLIGVAGCGDRESDGAVGMARSALTSRVHGEVQNWTSSPGDGLRVSAASVRFGADAVGDFFQFASPAPAGTYDITLRYAKRSLYGDYALLVGGVRIGTVLGYVDDKSDEWNTVTFTGVTLASGATIAFSVTGKDAAASDYDFKIDYLDFADAMGGGTAGGGTGGSGRGGFAGTGGSSGSGTGGGPASTGGGPASTGGGPASTGGASGTGGVRETGGAGGAAGASATFGQCRFHFGTNDSIAKNNSAIARQLDLFTPGWMGTADTFNMKYVCDETNPGALLANQVPAVVAYVAAFYAKRHANMKDCNAPGPQQDLCALGADYIEQHLSQIIAVYESYALGFAACYGTSRPIIFMMEPDFYQYTGSRQKSPWTAAHAGDLMSRFVGAIRAHLPNAVFSMDISPWVAPNNGADNGKSWYANFDMSAFTFIHTSGGGTDAASPRIRASNNMTWAGVHQVTGKPILADTGYGVNGASAGPDPSWDNPVNIRARMADGVVAISQYNPGSAWGSTIAANRAQLAEPLSCP